MPDPGCLIWAGRYLHKPFGLPLYCYASKGEMVLAGRSSPEPFIERAYALDLARLLAERHEEAQRVWTCSQMPLPEPELEPEPEPVMIYDLVRTCESLLQYVKQRQAD
jgi:hypothetical protein